MLQKINMGNAFPRKSLINMKTKALLLGALLAGSALTASAQSAGDFRFGVTAGMNVPKITDLNADCRIGFNVGVRGEYNFTNNVFADFGLSFTQKGCEYEYMDDDVAKVKMTPGYLEIPLNVGYRFNLGNNVSIFGATGPYFAFGVCGKTKVELLGKEDKVDFFDGDNGANVFDAGWGVKLGVEAKDFQIGFGYEYGFTKVVDDTSCHNSNFMVNVAYMF